VETYDVDALLSALLDSRNIASKLVDLIFDIRKDVLCSQVGEDLVDEMSWDGQTLVERNDVEGDVELVKLRLGSQHCSVRRKVARSP